jgi:hypothetical protein
MWFQQKKSDAEPAQSGLRDYFAHGSAQERTPPRGRAMGRDGRSPLPRFARYAAQNHGEKHRKHQ